MSRRPANFTQADIARAIRAAKQEGAPEIEVRIGAASIVVRLSPSTTSPMRSGPTLPPYHFNDCLAHCGYACQTFLWCSHV
jgi:hypothetical protein